MHILEKIKSIFRKKKIRLTADQLYNPDTDIKMFKTGDLICFSGTSEFSQLIKLKTHCKISHVGIVIAENNDFPIICESTTLIDSPDCETGELIKGVQKHKLLDRVNNYDGEVYHLPLNISLTDKKAMLDWLNDVHGKKIKYDYEEAIFSGFYIRHLIRRKENLSKLFCSELCCKALQIGTRGLNCFKVKNPSRTNPAELIKIKKVWKKMYLIKR